MVQDAIAAMGGDKVKAVQTITMKGGAGTRTRLQQTRHVADAEAPGTLANVVEVVDLAGGRASIDYEVNDGGFAQHRHEVLTTRGGKPVGIEYVGMRPVIATSPAGLFSWGTQNSPEMTLHRNIVGLLLEAAAAAGDAPADDRTFAGRMTKHTSATTKNGDAVALYFDPQTKLLAGFETTDTEALDGDVPAEYVFGDYKAVDGVLLPHKITIRKNGKDYSAVTYTSAAINDPAAQREFDIPEAASKEADAAIAAGSGDYSPLEIAKIADGVYFAKAYSHNSLIVEFPEWLAVVEAPYTDAQSKTLVRLLKEQFPNKPIRYAAVTHHHSDHVGGVRGIAATGATILVEKGHEPAIVPLVELHHTHPPDSLEAARSSGTKTSIEVYETKRVIADGKQRLELYAFMGSPHVEPMVMAYVPGAKVLFQSDLWFPGTGGAGNPAAKQLYDSIKALKLDVKTNAGGHGGVGPFAELEKAVKDMK